MNEETLGQPKHVHYLCSGIELINLCYFILAYPIMALRVVPVC